MGNTVDFSTLGKSIKTYRTVLTDLHQDDLGLIIWPELSRLAAQVKISKIEADMCNPGQEIFVRIYGLLDVWEFYYEDMYRFGLKPV